MFGNLEVLGKSVMILLSALFYCHFPLFEASIVAQGPECDPFQICFAYIFYIVPNPKIAFPRNSLLYLSAWFFVGYSAILKQLSSSVKHRKSAGRAFMV